MKIKVHVVLLVTMLMLLSGCGVVHSYFYPAKDHCLAPCYDTAIDKHCNKNHEKFKQEIIPMEHFRDMELLAEKGLCQIKCQ